MEYLLGILIVLNKAGRLVGLGRLQLLYFFSAAILIWFIVKKNMLVRSIALIFSAFAAFTLLVQLISGSSDWKAAGIFLIHMLLNITFMIWVVNSFEQLEKDNLILTVAAAHLILTLIAIFMQDSPLWQNAEYITGVRVMRLRLLYSDAAELSFVCGLFLLLSIYRFMTQEIKWKSGVAALIFIVDMIISYGMAGMVSFVVAVTFMIMSYIASHRRKVLQSRMVKTKWAALMIIIVVILVAIVTLSPVYGLRVQDIMRGTDNGLYYTVKQPLAAFIYTMRATGWRGVGMGGLTSTNVGAELGYSIGRNSFIKLLIKGGAVGIVFLVAVLFILLWMCLLYGKILNITLLVFAILFQCASGKFDDPMNWLLYGIILVDCLKTKAMLEERQEL